MRGEPPEFTAGTQNYDFVYIDDAALAFRLIGERGKPFCKYVIGSSTARPLEKIGGRENLILSDKDKGLMSFADFMEEYGGFYTKR